MATLWFAILVAMLAGFVVLDGFDFGVGIAHLFVAETDDERRAVLASIGPVWDGNEVLLIASGGVLVFSFPRVYAAAFSGFYLPLMMALWLLILRGISIEFRSHLENPLWRSFWDTTFAFASAVAAVVLGVALGNVVRGVPLDESGYFSAPLFTNFGTRGELGAIDWYTGLVGVFALVALAVHGTLYLALKTEGRVRERSVRLTKVLQVALVGLGAFITWATAVVQPVIFEKLAERPWMWPLPLIGAGGLVTLVLATWQGKDVRAFLGSCAFLAGMLGATAAGLYPWLLRSTVDPKHSLGVENAAAGTRGLMLGFVWWTPAMALAIGYFVYLYRSTRGRIQTGQGGHGY